MSELWKETNMLQIDNCQLEVDTDRGVLYVHSSDGVTLVRVCQIPAHVIELSYDKRGQRWKGMIDVVYDRELAKGRTMAEQLKCDKCGVVYTDKESIDMAKSYKTSWEALCRKGGAEPRGLTSCPVVPCSGELILEEV